MTHPTATDVSYFTGIDIGDRCSKYWVIDAAGERLHEGECVTTAEAPRQAFSGEGRPRFRIAIEIGNHTAWIHDELVALGHEVVIYNATEFARSTRPRRKSDRNDGLALANEVHKKKQTIRQVHLRSLEVRKD